MQAYSATSVHWSRSQPQIVKMLNDRQIYSTRFTNMTDRFAMEFIATVPGQEKPIAVRIIIPLKHTKDDDKRRENELNRLHRVLFHHLKAKFVSIDSGLTEFMEEFMPHLIVTDNKGNSTTMGAVLLPQYKKNLESGENKEFKLLSDGNQL